MIGTLNARGVESPLPQANRPVTGVKRLVPAVPPTVAAYSTVIFPEKMFEPLMRLTVMVATPLLSLTL